MFRWTNLTDDCQHLFQISNPKRSINIYGENSAIGYSEFGGRIIDTILSMHDTTLNLKFP